MLSDRHASLCVLITLCAHFVCSAAHPCPILCGPLDCSPPGSSVHGIFQARVLVWVAIPYSRRSSKPRDQITFFNSHQFAFQVVISPFY